MSTVDTFFVKQNDTLSALEYDLTDSSGSDVDISGASVAFTMRRVGAKTNTVDEQAASIVTNKPARVKYEWQAGDLATPGDYLGEFEVTFGSGGTMTFPNDKLGFPIRVTAELG